MEFTFTFAEIINKIIDLSLLGMESFIAIWLFAAFVSSAYPDSISSPATPTTPVAAAPIQESATIEPAPDVAATVNELNCKSLRKLLSTLEIKCSGMNKESMITTLLSKITKEELDISSLLARA
jgi:hypothetical protein